jgi:hypothetical protein
MTHGESESMSSVIGKSWQRWNSGSSSRLPRQILPVTPLRHMHLDSRSRRDQPAHLFDHESDLTSW